MTEAASPPAAEQDGPVAQSIQIGFGVLRWITILLALGWLVSNVRQVPADTQAVVLRFGEIIRVQPAGLVLAWPRPIEQVDLLPSPQRQLELKVVAGTATGPAIIDPASKMAGDIPPNSTGVYLTGDGGVVLLDATLTYRITDARAWYLASAHVAPALRRLFLSSAVSFAAGRTMDDFMVVRPEQTAGDPRAEAKRQAMRGALVTEVNRRLAVLSAAGDGLGIEVTRADVTALLPPAAKFAFDAVLDATQMAEQGLAAARTDAERQKQAANQERDRILQEARANGDERVNSAKSHSAAALAIEQGMDPASRPSLVDRLYRERIAAILHRAGTVNTVDLSGGNRVILPGGQP